MKRPLRFKTAALAGVAVASALIATSACSDMGEGERCNFDNGNDDCQDGLICLPATNQGGRGGGLGTVNSPYNNSDRCCPADRTTATHPACTVPQSGVGDAAPSADTGPTVDATTADTGADASSDASDASDAADAPDGD